MIYKVGNKVRYTDGISVGIFEEKIGTITYITEVSLAQNAKRIHNLSVIYLCNIEGEDFIAYPTSKEEADFCGYKRHILGLVYISPFTSDNFKEEEELNSYNQIIRKIDNLLLNGEKILEKDFVYEIDKIAAHRGEFNHHKKEFDYSIVFDQNKDLESPFSKVVYNYLETKYEDFADSEKEKEKTELLNQFESYINDIKVNEDNS